MKEITFQEFKKRFLDEEEQQVSISVFSICDR